MNLKFPKWISPKAFLLAAFVTGLQGAQQLYSSGFSTEAIVSFLVQIAAGGLLWGWLLTKFIPKYFGNSADTNSSKLD
jgi:hypothetical protein